VSVCGVLPFSLSTHTDKEVREKVFESARPEKEHVAPSKPSHQSCHPKQKSLQLALTWPKTKVYHFVIVLPCSAFLK
jgi:hypothetical protein